MLTSSESNLCQRITQRHTALLEDLKRHVELPTGPGGFAALDETRAIFHSRLAKLGATATQIPGDPKPDWLDPHHDPKLPTPPIPPTLLCIRTQNLPNKKRILLSGHLDTVHDPRGSFLKLNIAPNKKTATGPGCVDMKGGLVIALHALEALEEAGLDIAWSFILNSDEETGSYHSDSALRAAAKNHDFGLALEPAMENGGLVIERPGSGQFMLEVKGRAAHVGRDFKSGISAITALAERLVAISKMPDPDRGLIVNIAPIDGGLAPNVVPDHARAWGNVRYATPEIAEEIKQRLRDLTLHPLPEGGGRGKGSSSSFSSSPASSSSYSSSSPLPQITLHDSFNRPAKPLNPGTQHLADLARAAAQDLNQQLPFGKTGGVCDGNNLQAAGLPTIDTLGVRGGGLHTPNEWIDLTSLVERCQLLAVVMARISSQ
jgi:glutamate carboxypeptidase